MESLDEKLEAYKTSKRVESPPTWMMMHVHD